MLPKIPYGPSSPGSRKQDVMFTFIFLFALFPPPVLASLCVSLLVFPSIFIRSSFSLLSLTLSLSSSRCVFIHLLVSFLLSPFKRQMYRNPSIFLITFQHAWQAEASATGVWEAQLFQTPSHSQALSVQGQSREKSSSLWSLPQRITVGTCGLSLQATSTTIRAIGDLIRLCSQFDCL